jgi:hypothetical protein
MKRGNKLLATKAKLAFIFTLLFVGLGFSTMASAQGRKVIRLEAIKVEGRIQKPQAFYILPRQNLNFEGLKLKKSFIPKIIKSIDNKPF